MVDNIAWTYYITESRFFPTGHKQDHGYSLKESEENQYVVICSGYHTLTDGFIHCFQCLRTTRIKDNGSVGETIAEEERINMAKMIKHKLVEKIALLLFFLFAFASSVYSTTYYVRNGGNDSNAGTSPAIAWANIPGTAASSKSLNPGDTVYVDRDSTFTLTNTWSGNEWGRWGTFAGVTIDGSSWEYDGGTSGTRAHVIISSGAGGTAGLVFCRDHATYDTTIAGFDINGNGNYMNGVMFTAVAVPKVTIENGWKKLKNCVIHDFNSNGYFYGIRVYGYIESGTWTARYVEISNNEVYNTGRDGITVYAGGGGANRDVIIRGNIIHDCDLLPDADYYSGPAISVKDEATNITIEYNYTYNISSVEAIRITDVNSGTGFPQSITIRYNILNGSAATGHSTIGIIRMSDGGSGASRSLYIYGNILYNAYGPNLGMTLGSGENTSLYVYNNTLYNASIYIPNTNIVSCEVKNNVSYGGSYSGISVSEPVCILSNNLTSSPGFKNASNLPTGFTGTYPNMVPNNDGLSIVAGGAARDVGANLGSSFNTSINGVTRSGSWDIGAYESGTGSDSTPPPPPSGVRILGN